jgi:hypothetical protein
MPASRRARALLWLLLLSACQGPVEEPTGSASETAAASSTSSTATEPTTTTTEATTTAEMTTTTTSSDGECSSYAAGGWNQCQMGNVVNNKLCGGEEGSGAGTVLCLSPTSAPLNVCGIRDCVDVCDCFAPPSTGTAVPVCAPLFSGGGKGCALFCAGGQTCPDGMMCQSGYCYWPN